MIYKFSTQYVGGFVKSQQFLFTVYLVSEGEGGSCLPT